MSATPITGAEWQLTELLADCRALQSEIAVLVADPRWLMFCEPQTRPAAWAEGEKP